MEIDATRARELYRESIKKSLASVFNKIVKACEQQEFKIVLEYGDLTHLQQMYLKEQLKYSIIKENGKIIIMWPTSLNTGGSWMDI